MHLFKNNRFIQNKLAWSWCKHLSKNFLLIIFRKMFFYEQNESSEMLKQFGVMRVTENNYPFKSIVSCIFLY